MLTYMFIKLVIFLFVFIVIRKLMTKSWKFKHEGKDWTLANSRAHNTTRKIDTFPVNWDTTMAFIWTRDTGVILITNEEDLRAHQYVIKEEHGKYFIFNKTDLKEAK